MAVSASAPWTSSLTASGSSAASTLDPLVSIYKEVLPKPYAVLLSTTGHGQRSDWFATARMLISIIFLPIIGFLPGLGVAYYVWGAPDQVVKGFFRPGFENLGMAAHVYIWLTTVTSIVSITIISVGIYYGFSTYNPLIIRSDLHAMIKDRLPAVRKEVASNMVGYVAFVTFIWILGIVATFDVAIDAGWYGTRSDVRIVLIVWCVIMVPVVWFYSGAGPLPTAMELVLRAEISALETRLRLRTVDYRTASRLMTGILDQMASLNRGFAGYLLSMTVHCIVYTNVHFAIFFFAFRHWDLILSAVSGILYPILVLGIYAKLNSLRDALAQQIGAMEPDMPGARPKPGRYVWTFQEIAMLDTKLRTSVHAVLRAGGAEITNVVIARIFYASVAITIFLYNSSGVSFRALVGSFT